MSSFNSKPILESNISIKQRLPKTSYKQLSRYTPKDKKYYAYMNLIEAQGYLLQNKPKLVEEIVRRLQRQYTNEYVMKKIRLLLLC